ncbi:MAG: alpha/beta hydrolase [Bdellovibrionaceae bacterium]|nr:alpha/beta hydrolase [Pseudobdellovibrionaceae bacterium]
MLNIVFLHGLNTYGDDLLHLGPVRLAAMHAPWEKALSQRGHRVFCPSLSGTHDSAAQAQRVYEQLQEHATWSTTEELHLIGHSTGGLAARALAPLLGSRVRSIVTIGTPHCGTDASRFAQELAAQYPRMQRLMSWLGYDTQSRTEIYELFTQESARKFQTRFPPLAHIACAFALCEKREREVSWPLRPLYRQLHPTPESIDHSDGFIHSASQAFGACLDRFDLDHFENLGFILHVDPRRRRLARKEFEKLVDAICLFCARTVSK